MTWQEKSHSNTQLCVSGAHDDPGLNDLARRRVAGTYVVMEGIDDPRALNSPGRGSVTGIVEV